MQLRQTQRDLQDKIYCSKATYNALEDQQVIIDRDLANKQHSLMALEDQQVIIDRDLANKQHSLMTDVRCLDLRMRLRTGSFGSPATDTDRNIILTRMENEIPPT
ncbi:hypothetical protein QE152_g10254 [Popillia japonica]|uniref:Tektin n=1 Tax=Popillia japonica TaxID=7064 RepID=A0AAW1LVA6_POPJA